MPIQYPIILPPQGVRSITLRPKNSVMVSTSPFTGQQQVQAHQGQWWEADVEFPPMKQSGYADDIAAFITSLRGQYGTFLLGDSSRKTPRGSAGGIYPYVLSGGQTGLTLSTLGWTGGIANTFRMGDYIQIGGENALTRSSEFSHANWAKSGVTVTADSVTSPSFATDADTLEPTGSDSYVSQAFTASNVGPFTASVYLRTVSGSVTLALQIRRDTPSELIGSASVLVTTSWKRFTVSGVIATTASSYRFYIGGLGSWTSGETVVAWGAQANRGNDAGPLIPTTSAAISTPSRLHKITADAEAEPSGALTLEIWPRLRESPPVGSGIKVTNCQGTFRLASNDQGWSVDPAKIYSAGFSAVEAI